MNVDVTNVVIQIQRWYRRVQKKRYYSQICCNYNEFDPISLELIRDLSFDRLFFIKNEITSNVYAYDSIAWLQYFLTNKKHPVNRMKIENEDIWSCFQSALRVLPDNNETLISYRSKNVNVHMKNSVIYFRPLSPLLSISLRYTKTKYISNLKKEIEVCYRLTSNIDYQEVICDQKTITVTCPHDHVVSF